MNLFFTSDTHFGHTNVLRFSRRPFASIEEHDEALIARWNAVVGPKDEIWHLGDFNFRSTRDTGFYLDRLNGAVHLVLGNHDDKYAKKYRPHPGRKGFASVQEAKYLRADGEKLTLYHYAQRTWRNSHHGAWHLYGHSHGDLPPLGRSMDVGVDANDYRPVSLDEVRLRLKDQPLVLHHTVVYEDMEVPE